ncbi:M20/M25/M40 family metallo-hydrolase [Flavilitoribacter nigricans]|uniref:Acetylornithine deacetylase n=1 Tax=Flavilitoribacter nigricans (strain ATCC 23147 / DSM 23189 / NBRC 102662 / NCIMB 1420 / SS-2) TaxID=1122177 RepID=A0A2D0N3Y8_FLAN2|nr:M20/M25/M40 family metallo-hydrolase [Flavilitoribacter nigricans]PHN03157.1 acetylornithine deacetylase [Flavilitoribacter nigricans DSM 23189 = NBRC 102662]
MQRLLTILLFSFPLWALAQDLSTQRIEQLAEKHARQTLPELVEFLSLPNDAHFPEQLEHNIAWLEKAFGKRDFTVERLSTGGIDLVLARYQQDPALPTVLIYVQVDGQPVDPGKWQQVNPFTPTLKQQQADGAWEAIELKKLYAEPNPDWRIFARSASDAKGPINMFLAAWDAMKEAGKSPLYNIKLIMDCEEEMGSPNLPPAVEVHRDKLAADHLIILDGPPHISNAPTLVFGARGIATVRLTTYGPRVPQHSGHYGNYAPNPALRLAQLLAGMKDDQGRVTIPGWYDGISIDPEARTALEQVPDDLEAINKKLGIAEPDAVGNTLQESLQYPSLNIRGLSSGWVGAAARTIVPAAAVANLDIRLVRESDPEHLIGLLRDYIRSEGYHILEEEPTDAERAAHPRLLSMGYQISYAAFRTDMDSPTGKWLERAMTHTFGKSPILIRTHGGSVPIAPFVKTLDVPAVLVPLVNPDNNQHSPNENLRIGNYFSGVRTCLGILTTGL